MVKALIFNGTGVGQTCLPRTTDALMKYNIPFATATKINQGTLKGFNVLFLPGGDSAYKLYVTNKNVNAADIKEWIKTGGVVIATCSGAYASINNVDGLYKAYGLAPNTNAKVYSENGIETVQFTTTGQKVFNRGTKLKMSHEAGPALYMPPGPGKEVLAIYTTGTYKGYGAIVVDGNVGLFSPHPELNPYYPDMIINLMNYLLKKNEGSEVMGLMDKNYDYKILKNDFKLMIDGVTNWLKSHANKPPATVYLRVNGVKSLTNYVSYGCYVKMKAKWDAFITANKREPAYITPRPSTEGTTPTPTPTKSTTQLKVEKSLAFTFNNFTQFYNYIKQNKHYLKYFDDQLTFEEVLKKKFDYTNCVDICQAGIKLARAMGYTATAYGIHCNAENIGHAIFKIKGKEFKTETWIDLAAASGENYPIGSHWCNGSLTKEPGWIPYE